MKPAKNHDEPSTYDLDSESYYHDSFSEDDCDWPDHERPVCFVSDARCHLQLLHEYHESPYYV